MYVSLNIFLENFPSSKTCGDGTFLLLARIRVQTFVFFRKVPSFVFTILKNRVLARIRVPTFFYGKCPRWFIKREQLGRFNACSEKCHTSKLILTISWINYVLDKCYRWFINGARTSYFNAYSEKCHTSKLMLIISWINSAHFGDTVLGSRCCRIV